MSNYYDRNFAECRLRDKRRDIASRINVVRKEIQFYLNECKHRALSQTQLEVLRSYSEEYQNLKAQQKELPVSVRIAVPNNM